MAVQQADYGKQYNGSREECRLKEESQTEETAEETPIVENEQPEPENT